MAKEVAKRERGSIQELNQQYKIERELADRLRNASHEERCVLYSSLYDDFFRRLPHHPLLAKKTNSGDSDRAAYSKIRLVRRFATCDTTFLEVGPGDCRLSLELAKLVKKVYAVDVSTKITEVSQQPENFELIISDGCSVPVPENSIDVAYSSQVMEHVHPDDALEHLHSIYRALAPKGVFLCLTPHRFTGPHDVSKYFDDIATGLHLKEYTNAEMVSLLNITGFSKVGILVGFRNRIMDFPSLLVMTMETLLDVLPNSLRKRISRWKPIRRILGINMIAWKQA